jgi:DNA invertase Pin-like site-specific DNA recombinase
MAKINCAVYVRKSTEYGLEQEFNSLQNQEQACRNYILSQTFGGWEYYKTYTDGGISGGTMERPALKEMLADMRAGKIQCVLVYKIDRLSRSIYDFKRMMKEDFEKHDCNLVSITQSFDTSTAMGKLTLNMLLSFAEFEREVASERVRDKIRASKAKGMWTGGIPHIGYDIVDKKLVVNDTELEQVRTIFEKYIELKSLTATHEWALENGFKNKQWTTGKGRAAGGNPITRNTIDKMLNDQLYIGKIENKVTKESYAGNHPAIISTELFNAAQEILKENNQRNSAECIYGQYLLNNKITDSDGNNFKNQSSSRKTGHQYRYYHCKGNYLPAGDVEKITKQVTRDLLNSDLTSIADDEKIMALKSIKFEEMTTTEMIKFYADFIDKIVYADKKLTYFINTEIPREFRTETYMNPNNNPLVDKTYKTDNERIVVEKEIIINDHVSTNRYEACGKTIVTKSENAQGLIKALAYGWKYRKMYEDGIQVDEIKKQEKMTGRTIYKYLDLAYLSPRIVNNIMESNVPSGIGLQDLFKIAATNHDFSKQENAFFKN